MSKKMPERQYRFRISKGWWRWRWTWVGHGLVLIHDGESRGGFRSEMEAIKDAEAWADARESQPAATSEHRYTPEAS